MTVVAEESVEVLVAYVVLVTVTTVVAGMVKEASALSAGTVPTSLPEAATV